jgi:uncharacterized protein YbjT (DUF2867 family)
MIVITTPTGGIGSQLLNLLITRAPDHAEQLRVVVRDPSKLPAHVLAAGVDIVPGSHGDADVIDRAFAGADAVFWLVPPDPRAGDLDAAYAGFTTPAAGAFGRHGVTHVVGVSALGRTTPVAGRAGLVTASLAMDDLIAASGPSYRALANPSFMDNVLRQTETIRDDGVYVDTLAPGRAAPLVATRDIAVTAAGLLLDRSWSGFAEVPLLGPADVSAAEMVATMTSVLGFPVRYQQQSLEERARTLLSYGVGAAFVRGMVEMIEAKDAGLDDGIARTGATATPTSFRQWCVDVLKPAVAR